MIAYAISNYGVSASHVYVTGTSSGAMMTNVMAGLYPSACSGVPFGCFAGTSAWNSACANGDVSKTAAQWGDIVRAAYPEYSGPRPKMMLWHGTAKVIKEWTNVLDVSQTPTPTSTNDPQSRYTKTTHGFAIVGYSGQGVGHTVPVHEAIELAWFCITGGSSSGSITTSRSSSTTPISSTPATTPLTSSSGSSTRTAAHWGQCGGNGWTGATACVSPYQCKVANAWYSQCL